jgi:DNA (cytosine-5)-methyltransferase 1
MVARRRARLDPRPVGRRGSLHLVRRLSPRFVEWMMGLDDGWVTAVPGLTRNDQLKALGNGVVPQQAAAALSTLLAWRAAAIGEVTRSA